MIEIRQQHRGLFWFTVVCAVTALALVVYGANLRKRYEEALKAYKRDQAILSSLQRAPVALTPENVQAAQNFLGELELRAVQVESGLSTVRYKTSPAYTRPEDIYFELFSMVEAQRDAFTKASIQFSDTEQFGYEAVIQNQRVILPAALDTPEGRVYAARLDRQKQTLEAVLAALRTCEVAELLSVERTSFETQDEGALLGPDLFAFDPSLSLAAQGTVETYPVRLEFRAKTAALRQLLVALRSAEIPVVLRDLQVRMATNERRTRDRSASTPASPFRSFGAPRAETGDEPRAQAGVAIVKANESIFTLYLEGYYILPSEPVEGRVAL